MRTHSPVRGSFQFSQSAADIPYHPLGNGALARRGYSRRQLFANAPIAASQVAVAVRRRAILMMPKGERPHPRHSHRHSGRLHDPADDDAIGEHVEVVVVPFAGWARSHGAFED